MPECLYKEKKRNASTRSDQKEDESSRLLPSAKASLFPTVKNSGTTLRLHHDVTRVRIILPATAAHWQGSPIPNSWKRNVHD